MKKIVFYITAIFLSKISIAQTDVSGTFSSDAHWTTAGSPYNVVGDIQLTSAATLTIDPGVQVYFKNGSGIVVNGAIHSVGTSAQNINFNGDVSGKIMILFRSADLSKSVFTFVQFMGYQTAIQLADETESTQDAIKNSNVLTVTSSFFISTAIQTKGYKTNASLHLDNTYISSTLLTTFELHSETIEINNGFIGKSTIISNCGPSFLIQKSEIVATSLTLNSATISGSTISGCNFIDGPNFIQYLSIDDCKITNAPLILPKTQLYMTNCAVSYDSPIAIEFGTGAVSCSEITGNGTGTAIRLVSWTDFTFVGICSIHNTTLNQNAIGVDMEQLPAPPKIDSNNFVNNSLYHLRNLSGQPVNGINWWDSNDSTTIAAKIYDHEDDNKLLWVNISNRLRAPYHSAVCTGHLISGITTLDKSKSFEVTIYPNPSSAIVNLQFGNSSGGQKKVITEIVDMTGKVVYLKQQDNLDVDQTLDLSELTKGMYFCRVSAGNATIVKKIVIQ
jgi:hypothetical protein